MRADKLTSNIRVGTDLSQPAGSRSVFSSRDGGTVDRTIGINLPDCSLIAVPMLVGWAFPFARSPVVESADVARSEGLCVAPGFGSTGTLVR